MPSFAYSALATSCSGSIEIHDRARLERLRRSVRPTRNIIVSEILFRDRLEIAIETTGHLVALAIFDRLVSFRMLI